MNLVLFHSGMSTCSQKVRLALAEKQVEWTSHELNLVAGEQRAAEYVRLNPKGVVPTLVVDQTPIIESTLINEYIAEAFDGDPLWPTSPLDRSRARLWPKRIDEGVHSACGALTFATVMRSFQLKRPREEVIAEIAATPDASHAALRLSLFEKGTEAPEFATALRTMQGLFDSMERALEDLPWLSGASFGLADCAAAPYAIRFDQFGLTHSWKAKGLNKVLHWYDAVRKRPSFEVAVARWENPMAAKSFALAGEKIAPMLSV